MDALEHAWVVALIVTVGALPAGLLRTVAVHSGDPIQGSRTPRIAARFALALGLLGLVCLLALSLAIALR